MQVRTSQLRTAALVGLACGVVAATSGCSVFDGKTKKSNEQPWSISKLWKKEYQKPNTISVIWSPDVLTVTGKPPTRGFGGRVFFYNDRTQAVPVEGELIVHGYRGDPMVGESEQVQADKTFAFTAEQLTSHFSPTDLGASYSIWIPWDAADGLRAEITLIPTFKGLDGTIVQGAPAKLFLPGRSLDGARGSAATTQTVSYQQQTISTNPAGKLPQRTRETQPTTIELPALGTLGRPRSGPTNDAAGFTLGSASNAGFQYQPPALQTPAQHSSLQYSPNQYSPNQTSSALQPTAAGAGALPNLTLPQVDQVGYSNATELMTEGLPGIPMGHVPPSLSYGVQATSPFAHQPWHVQASSGK